MPLTDLPPLLATSPASRPCSAGPPPSWPCPSRPAPSPSPASADLLRAASPIVVAAPTTGDAERLAHDLGAFLGADAVDLFPAWETLPFERVSPVVETMGRRLRTLWRLRDPERAPRVARGAGAGARAAARAPRRGRRAGRRRPGRAASTATSWSRALVAAGYRREDQVEHRGEVAVRGSIVDVFPSTADRPVRIDLWGDEVDRLTEFSVGRPALHRRPRPSVEIFPCRELLPTDEVRARAERLDRRRAVGPRAVGAAGRGPDLRRHGVVAAVAHRRRARAVRPASAPTRSGAAASSPAACATGPPTSSPRRPTSPRTLAETWGADGERRSPRLHLAVRPAARPTPTRRRGPSPPRPRVPTSPPSRPPGWDPVVGDGVARWSRQLAAAARRRLPGRRRRPTAPARPPASPTLLGRARACTSPSTTRRRRPHPARRPHRRSRRSSAASSCPASKLAVLAEPDLTGRRRAHRRARPRDAGRARVLRRPQGRRLRRAPPARRRPLRRHGQAGHRRRRARLPAARVPGRRQALRAVRPDRRRPPLHRRRLARPSAGSAAASWQKTKAKVRVGGAPRSPRSWWCSTRSACTRPGHAFAARHAVAARARGGLPLRGDARPAHGHRRGQGRHGGRPSRWTAWCAATSASARPRSPSGPRSRRCRTASRSRCSCPPRCWPSSTSRPSATASPATRCGSRCCQPLPHHRARPARWSQGVRSRRGRRRHRHPPAAVATTSTFKDLGLLVVDEEQRFGVSHKEQIKQLQADVDVLTLTATPIPRTLEMSLTGIRDLTLLNTPPAERQPILTYVGEYDDRAVGRGDPPRAAARGPGVLRAQPGAGHRAGGRPRCATSCPRPASPSPTARWTRARSSRSCSTSGRASTTCSSAPRSSSRASTCRR